MIHETVSATGIVRDYWRRDIAPNETHQVAQGELKLWIWNNLYVGELVMGDIHLSGPYAYRNTSDPQEIANDIYQNAGGDVTVATLAVLDEEILTIGDAIDLASTIGKSISDRTIRYAADNGFIQGATKQGRDWLIPKSGFLTYLNNRPKPGRK